MDVRWYRNRRAVVSSFFGHFSWEREREKKRRDGRRIASLLHSIGRNSPSVWHENLVQLFLYYTLVVIHWWSVGVQSLLYNTHSVYSQTRVYSAQQESGYNWEEFISTGEKELNYSGRSFVPSCTFQCLRSLQRNRQQASDSVQPSIQTEQQSSLLLLSLKTTFHSTKYPSIFFFVLFVVDVLCVCST